MMTNKGVNIKKSGLSGIYYDESSVQKHGRKPDRHFYYRFKYKQQSFKEYTGWMSEGMTGEITQEKKEEHKKSLNRNSIIYPRNITFREIGKVFFEEKKDMESIKPEEYRYKRLTPLYDMKVNEISIIDLNRIKETMIKDGNSNQTVNHLFVLFTRICRFAIEAKKIESIPCKPQSLKVPPKALEKLTEEEQVRYLNMLFQYPDRTVAQPIALVYFTGIRRGDVCRLKAEDFDPKNKTLWLSKPKDGIPKFLPINNIAIGIIEQQPKFEHGYMFSNKYGEALDPNRLTRFGNEIKKAVGIVGKNFRPIHGLRHNYATMLATSGQLHPIQIQHLLTHKDYRTTERYIDIDMQDMQKSVLKTDAIILGNYQQQTDIIQMTKVKVG